jgi:hypothetical protein
VEIQQKCHQQCAKNVEKNVGKSVATPFVYRDDQKNTFALSTQMSARMLQNTNTERPSSSKNNLRGHQIAGKNSHKVKFFLIHAYTKHQAYIIIS